MPEHCRGGGHSRENGLFEYIVSPENLFAAWREFHRGKHSKPDIQLFEFNLEDNIFQLHEELVGRTYHHGEYEPFNISDPKPRRIHKATVRDRLVHHALFRVLCPIFDKSFIHDSYSCRIGKGTHRAVKQLKSFLNKASGNNSRNTFALKCDIKRFFDSVDHTILLSLIRRKISDNGTIWLIEYILGSFRNELNVGLPLGNVTSQLFANIYLNELDRFVKHNLRVPFYLRYCDDFVILLDDRGKAEELIADVSDFLRCHLHLSLHPDKISLRTYRQGIDFVGYVVRPHCTTLRTKTKQRMIRRITAENQESYLGTLRHCDGFKIERAIKHELIDRFTAEIR